MAPLLRRVEIEQPLSFSWDKGIEVNQLCNSVPGPISHSGRNHTLEVYKGAPDGMCSTFKDKVNAELLSLFKSRARGHREENMNIDNDDTAVVFIDPQNEVLSERGLAWPLVRESLQENHTIENMERIFKAAKAHRFEILYLSSLFLSHG